MRNLSISSSVQSVIESAIDVVEDAHSGVVVVVKIGSFEILDESLKLVEDIKWPVQEVGSVVNTTFLLDGSNEVITMFSDGVAFVLNILSYEVVVHKFNFDVVSASWSPLGDIVAIATNDDLKIVGRDFNILAETNISESVTAKRINSLVSVGWGSRETQFQGSAGKNAREKDVIVSRNITASDFGRTLIKWRADGAFFLLSTCCSVEGETQRHNVLFNENGEVLSHLENIFPLDEVFAIRPVGDYIATTRRDGESLYFVFFERNGEIRHEALIGKDSRVIEWMEWDSDGGVLSVSFKEPECSEVQLWTVSNYKWDVKWSCRMRNLICVKSDLERAKRYLFLTNSSLTRLAFSSGYLAEESRCISFGTDGIRVTDLKKSPIPPPLCHFLLPIGADDTARIHCASINNENCVLIDSRMNLCIWNLESKEISKRLSLECILDNTVVKKIECRGNDLILVVIGCDGDQLLFVDFGGMITRTITVHSCVLSLLFWSGKLVIGTSEGNFMTVRDDDLLEPIYSIEPSDEMKCTANGNYIFTLNKTGDLYANDQRIQSEVSSFIVVQDFIAFISLTNKLKLIELSNDTLSVVNYERCVEIGSTLVGYSSCSSSLTMQLPRGNLETICPQPFALKRLLVMMNELRFTDALQHMKKHRIDMKRIVLYHEELLVNHMDLFLASDAELLNLFVASLSQSTSSVEKISPEKSNEICAVMTKALLAQNDATRIRLFTVLLSAFLTSTPPQVIEALEQLKKHMILVNGRDDKLRSWLHHMRFFVNDAALFSASLATYDLPLVVQVAEATNGDPKEFLPLLNEIRLATPEAYRAYKMDVLRKDWHSALRHLSTLPERFEEAVTLITEKSLHAYALRLFSSTDFNTQVVAICANEAFKRASHSEAGWLFVQLGDWEMAQKCAEMAYDPDLLRAIAPELDSTSLVAATRRIARSLGDHGARHYEAAELLATIDPHSVDVLESWMKTSHWPRALQCAISIGSEAVDNVRIALSARCASLLDETSRIAEVIERHSKRLQTVRDSKELRFQTIKEGLAAGRDLENIDAFSDVMSLASTSSRSSRGSRASSTATARKRKQVERKKQSLKEGGEYEDSALLRTLHEEYARVNGILNEMPLLLPSLMRMRLFDEAHAVQMAVSLLEGCARSKMPHIWPGRILLKHLTGPLHVLFTEDGILSIPESATMPSSISLDPELSPPILVDSKWKRMVLD